MSPTKAAFLKDKDLADRLGAVVGTDWWTRAITFARGEMMGDPLVTAERIRGAIQLEAILRNLPEPEPESVPYPVVGLNHDLDNPTKKPI